MPDVFRRQIADRDHGRAVDAIGANAFGEVSPVEVAHQAEAMKLLTEKYCYDTLTNAESYIQKMLGYMGVYCMEVQHLTGKVKPEMIKQPHYDRSAVIVW